MLTILVSQNVKSYLFLPIARDFVTDVGVSMMHIMELPKIVIIGRNLEDKIVDIVSDASSGKKVLVITGRTSYSVYGKNVADLLSKRFSVDVHIIEGDALEEYESILNSQRDYEVIIGIGGGKTIDVSKAVAYKMGSKFVSVPTVASHDGIASPMFSFMKGNSLYSKKARMPYAIVADLNVIESAPRRYLSSGCGDLVAKYTAVKDWVLGHKVNGEYYGDYAASLAKMSAEIVFKNAKRIGKGDTEGVKIVVEALISAGVAMGIAGSSRPCSGSEHLITHALTSLVKDPPLHGEACGLSTIVAAYMHRAAWRKVKETLAKVGAPTSLSDVGIDVQTFARAISIAPSIRPERYTILHKLRPSMEEAKKILYDVELA